MTQHHSVLDEISKLLLRRKRGVEDRMRNGNPIRDLTAVDQIQARLTMSLKPGMKTQRIMCKPEGRRSAAHGFHGT